MSHNTVPLSAVLILAFAARIVGAEAMGVTEGILRCGPCADEAKVPERFRLRAEDVPYRLRSIPGVSERYEVSTLTFPSPMKTVSAINNMVQCEYYSPRIAGKRPAVIVLHVLGGDLELSRMFCHALARQDIASLFLIMPWYGPRRDPQLPNRIVSGSPTETIAGMTQAVLDIRRATNWLAARPEVDTKRVGLLGISFGGITGALAMAAEPRLTSGCLYLAGGDVGRIAWDSPEFDHIRPRLIEQGYTQKKLSEELQPIDPITYAAELRGRRVLMLNGRHDDIIPPACSESLRAAFGPGEIVWYAGNHYTATWGVLDVMLRAQRFFK